MVNPDLSIIVPVFNEQENISILYESIESICKSNGYEYEILFIDDGSTDRTVEILKALESQEGSSLRLIQLSRNFGQTAALAAGFDEAKGRYIVTMDGDMQNDPADIPKLLEKIKEGYDVVNGWRKRRKDPFFSVKFPSYIANRIIKKVTGVKIHDTGCTLKIFQKEILEDLHLYGEMHRFIPALLHWSGARIGEVEVNHRKREHGTSKYGIQKLPRVILDLFNVKFLISYSTRPIQIFGKFGLYAFLFSFLSLLALIGMKVYWNIDMTGNPFLLLSVVLTFLGVQFITIGLLGEINIRTYHESVKKKIYKIARTPGIKQIADENN